MLALVVKLLRRLLLPRRAVLECIKVKGICVRPAGRRRNDAGMMVGGRRNARNEGRHEQLCKVEVAYDVRAPLKVVSVLGQLVGRREHHAAEGEAQSVAVRRISCVEGLRVIEEDMELVFFTKELLGRLLD